jgi:hypothetical protein
VALPDFFVVGAPKGGTTAIHAAMARHPGLFLSNPKEPKFFLCAGTSRGAAGTPDPATVTAHGSGSGAVTGTKRCSTTHPSAR